MESPFEILGRHADPAHCDVTSHEKLVLPKRTQNSDPLPGIASGDYPEDWKFQISEATSRGPERFFVFRLLGEERILLGPRGPRAGEATCTYPTRPSCTTSGIRTPRLDAASLRGLPPWYHRSLVSLVVRRRMTTRSQQARRSLTTWSAHAVSTILHGGLDGTWRDAIGDGNRLRQLCQAGIREENSLCKLRAPNKILHTEQDTTHFFFLDGDTIKVGNKPFVTSCTTTDQMCC